VWLGDRLATAIMGQTEGDSMPDPSILNLKGRNVEATTKELSSIWGIDSWETLEFAPPQSAMRVGSAFKVKIAKANLLGLSFHIYAPVDDLDTFARSSPGLGQVPQTLHRWYTAHMRKCRQLGGGGGHGKSTRSQSVCQ
jgi:hypothetical protein